MLEQTHAVLRREWAEFDNISAIDEFLQECERHLKWREHEAEPLPEGVNAALVRWDQIGEPSLRWTAAVRALGYSDRSIRLPFIAKARTVGTNLGGHNCGQLLAFVALELAQPWRSQTFFCDLMPWAWAGRWPASIRDETGQVLLAYG